MKLSIIIQKTLLRKNNFTLSPNNLGKIAPTLGSRTEPWSCGTQHNCLSFGAVLPKVLGLSAKLFFFFPVELVRVIKNQRCPQLWKGELYFCNHGKDSRMFYMYLFHRSVITSLTNKNNDKRWHKEVPFLQTTIGRHYPDGKRTISKSRNLHQSIVFLRGNCYAPSTNNFTDFLSDYTKNSAKCLIEIARSSCEKLNRLNKFFKLWNGLTLFRLWNDTILLSFRILGKLAVLSINSLSFFKKKWVKLFSIVAELFGYLN